MRTKMRVILFPDDDERFVTQVSAAVAEVEKGMPDGHMSPSAVAELMRSLLPSYPGLEIRQQDGLASFEAEPRTWYVYRDGSARPG